MESNNAMLENSPDRRGKELKRKADQPLEQDPVKALKTTPLKTSKSSLAKACMRKDDDLDIDFVVVKDKLL